jgi:hypothetical protein
MKAICATALKQNIRIGLLIFLALAVVGTGLFFLFDLAFSVSPKIYDEDALAGEPDLVLGENDFREIIHPEICTVRFCEKPILGSDGKLRVYLTNPAGQKSSLKIDVYAVIEKPNSEGKIEYAPGELLGSSYFVRPGEYLPTVEIKGNHEKNEKIYLKISSRDNETGESHGFFYVPALLLK